MSLDHEAIYKAYPGIVVRIDDSEGAFDKDGNFFEYKVSKNHSWNFQDISENVLNKYLKDKSIILGVVDKEKVSIKDIYEVNPRLTINRLREKLEEKKERFNSQNKTLRRLQVSLSKGDLDLLDAKKLFSNVLSSE